MIPLSLPELCVLDDRSKKGDLATDGTQVLVSPACDSSSLAPCLHEEVDTRMFVHAADAASRGHKKIIIRSVDTDVVVLAVYGFHNLEEMNFG